MISIVVPIHNEEAVLPELAERVHNVMVGEDWELLLVDDKSTDNSHRLMLELAKKYQNIVVLQNERRRGQTGCFRNGFDHAKGDITITMDGDLQVMPEDLPLFINKMEQGYDVVNGIREHRQHVFRFRLLSRFYNLLMLLFFNCPVIDAASNFTIFKTKFIKDLRLKNNDHRYIIPIVVKRGAEFIGEVVVRHREREKGKTKYKMWVKILSGGPEIVKAFFRIKMGRCFF